MYIQPTLTDSQQLCCARLLPRNKRKKKKHKVNITELFFKVYTCAARDQTRQDLETSAGYLLVSGSGQVSHGNR